MIAIFKDIKSRENTETKSKLYKKYVIMLKI